ncbi:bifunctional bis(5'-adenosyl)-triphosphatase/adenylylsulfatase FHIT-like isoform X3 [Humulus lupulus]|uniref:bifunctional bis(5'-adenosyl)-triphosphatase/adenylylsulfatase FHIT-like isoform X3 n=1 Tax=Humulus lupulus TaxID=3486 RepID=UPI002B41384F|nr:bifunctional bis(5'-adenosyl)-triphosphatase/adenylylsulfatase FHIT-like isoform X3 [Humulus lupulus]
MSQFSSSFFITVTNKMAMEIESFYTFGPHKISSKDVFYTTHLSFAFVNLRPVLPGHVLVCPLREVKRFADLTTDETNDLWTAAHKISGPLQSYHKAPSLTFTIQIDDSDKKLKQKVDSDIEWKDRSPEDRAQEAEEYRKFFL